jgi:hypothetical protein
MAGWLAGKSEDDLGGSPILGHIQVCCYPVGRERFGARDIQILILRNGMGSQGATQSFPTA